MAFRRSPYFEEENDQVTAAAKSGIDERSRNNPYQGDTSDPSGSSASTAAKSPYTTAAPGTVDPGNFGLPTSGSAEWYGQLDEYGSRSAAANPGVFWDLYGQEQLGLNAGSATSQFYNENYNPYLLGQAYGNKAFGDESKLAQGQWLAGQLAKPGTTFFDPGQMVTSILAQIAGATGPEGASGQFNELNAIAIGDPATQMENILNFLGETLKSAMPPDTLQAYLGWIQQIGMEIVSEAMKGGIAGFEKGGANIADALMRRIGPNGGL